MLDLTPFWLSLKLAFFTTLILFFISIPMAYFLANYKGKFKPFLEAFFSLPIVLPPSVLGYYLLIGLSSINKELVFSFQGILIASLFYSLPFMLNPITTAIETFDKSLIEMGLMLKKSRLQILRYIILPNIKAPILSALVITFGHTIGEFGVVLMVGGSIDGVTKVASIAIYDYTETMEYHLANVYSLILLLFSFLILLSVYFVNRKFNVRY
jgi:molybdate transport system permease protein